MGLVAEVLDRNRRSWFVKIRFNFNEVTEAQIVGPAESDRVNQEGRQMLQLGVQDLNLADYGVVLFLLLDKALGTLNHD